MHNILLGNFILSKIFKKSHFKNIIDIQIVISTFFISNLILIINFFLIVTPSINTILFLIPFITLFFLTKEFVIRSIFYALKFSILVFLLISLDNVNRPDSGLYHLPFINILNENKIIIGLSNLHFRFGHTSIIQYLSASYNNIFFGEKGIIIPVCLILYSSIHYFYLELKRNLKKDNLKFFIYSGLILFQILYSMNRYSAFGNDVPGHLLFFLTCYVFLKIKKNIEEDLTLLIILSIYTFQNKSTLLLVGLLPIFFLKFLFTKKNIFISFFLLTFLFKNLLVSGCFIFPIKFTCLDVSWSSSKYFNVNSVDKVSIENEAWAKSWPGSKKNYVDFLKSDWKDKWLKDHGPIVGKKLLPIMIILSFLIIISKRKKLLELDDNNFGKKNFYIFFVTLTGSLLWFYKFPTYRYGESYLIIFIISFAIFFIGNIKYKFQNLFKKFIILMFVIITLKCLAKFNKKEFYSLWPNIYSFDFINYNKKELKPIFIGNDIAYYKTNGNELCMYSRSPCTSIDIPDLAYYKVLGYKIFRLKNLK